MLQGQGMAPPEGLGAGQGSMVGGDQPPGVPLNHLLQPSATTITYIWSQQLSEASSTLTDKGALQPQSTPPPPTCLPWTKHCLHIHQPTSHMGTNPNRGTSIIRTGAWLAQGQHQMAPCTHHLHTLYTQLPPLHSTLQTSIHPPQCPYPHAQCSWQCARQEGTAR